MDIIGQILNAIINIHPWHSMVVHFPIGLTGGAFLFVVLARWRRNESLERAAFYMIALAAVSTVVAALTGLCDDLVRFYGAGPLASVKIVLGVKTVSKPPWCHCERPPGRAERRRRKAGAGDLDARQAEGFHRWRPGRLRPALAQPRPVAGDRGADVEAARADGELVRGVLRATSGADVLEDVTGRGLVPLSVCEVPVRPARRLPVRDLAVFFRSLSTLLTAGIPLHRAPHATAPCALADVHAGLRHAGVAGAIRDGAQRGPAEHLHRPARHEAALAGRGIAGGLLGREGVDGEAAELGDHAAPAVLVAEPPRRELGNLAVIPVIPLTLATHFFLILPQTVCKSKVTNQLEVDLEIAGFLLGLRTKVACPSARSMRVT